MDLRCDWVEDCFDQWWWSSVSDYQNKPQKMAWQKIMWAGYEKMLFAGTKVTNSLVQWQHLASWKIFLSSFVFILWHQLRGGFIFSYFVASYSVSSIMHVFRWTCPLITCLVKWTASRRPFVSLHDLSCYSISEVDLRSHCYLVFHHAYVPMDVSFFVVALYSSCMYSYSQAEAAEVREFPLHPTWICCPPSPRVVVAFSVEEMQAEIGCVQMFVIDGQSSVLSRWTEACSRAYSGKGCEFWMVVVLTRRQSGSTILDWCSGLCWSYWPNQMRIHPQT